MSVVSWTAVPKQVQPWAKGRQPSQIVPSRHSPRHRCCTLTHLMGLSPVSVHVFWLLNTDEMYTASLHIRVNYSEIAIHLRRSTLFAFFNYKNRSSRINPDGSPLIPKELKCSDFVQGLVVRGGVCPVTPTAFATHLLCEINSPAVWFVACRGAEDERTAHRAFCRG